MGIQEVYRIIAFRANTCENSHLENQERDGRMTLRWIVRKLALKTGGLVLSSDIKSLSPKLVSIVFKN
jgi:hypothetical protein